MKVNDKLSLDELRIYMDFEYQRGVPPFPDGVWDGLAKVLKGAPVAPIGMGANPFDLSDLEDISPAREVIYGNDPSNNYSIYDTGAEVTVVYPSLFGRGLRRVRYDFTKE